MIGCMYDVVVCRMTRRPGARLHREQGGNGGQNRATYGGQGKFICRSIGRYIMHQEHRL